jgi:hypothetical protein
MNDHVDWDEHTPPSICLQEPDSRLLLATYNVNSVTFTPSTQSQRWGIETLRIPQLTRSTEKQDHSNQVDGVRAGDCLVTIGLKRTVTEPQPDDQDNYERTLIWHPQRVLEVQPDIDGRLKVWLARDNDVASQSSSPEDLDIHIDPQLPITRMLTESERINLSWAFNLDAFCPDCGSRGRPILSGMQDFTEPSYVSLGGCIL